MKRLKNADGNDMLILEDHEVLTALPLLATTNQVADWLQLSQRTIRRKRSAKRIPQPIYLCDQPRWVVQDLLDAIEAQRPSGSRALLVSGLGLPRRGNPRLDSHGQVV